MRTREVRWIWNLRAKRASVGAVGPTISASGRSRAALHPRNSANHVAGVPGQQSAIQRQCTSTRPHYHLNLLLSSPAAFAFPSYHRSSVCCGAWGEMQLRHLLALDWAFPAEVATLTPPDKCQCKSTAPECVTPRVARSASKVRFARFLPSDCSVSNYYPNFRWKLAQSVFT